MSSVAAQLGQTMRRFSSLLCSRQNRVVGGELCDAHHKGFRWLRWHRGEDDLGQYLEHLQTGRDRGRPRFDLRGLGPVVALELGYALQCRRHARGAAITPLIFGQVVRRLRERPVDSLLIGSDAAWVRAAEERFAAGGRANPLAWVRYCRRVLGRLRDQRHEGEVWDWDTWPTDRVDPDGRYAHQKARRIYFAGIEPGWLRELAKRWARRRITTATKSPGSVAVSTSSLRTFTSWLADRDALPTRPAEITRALLVDYRAHVHTLPVSPARRSGHLTALKVFLDDVRLHDWAPGLPANATYYRGEIPQPALRAQIEQLRDRAPVPTSAVPTRQRATEASLRQRVETLRAENQRLREENTSLKIELAIAYGQQRQVSSR